MINILTQDLKSKKQNNDHYLKWNEKKKEKKV